MLILTEVLKVFQNYVGKPHICLSLWVRYATSDTQWKDLGIIFKWYTLLTNSENMPLLQNMVTSRILCQSYWPYKVQN
jgi:hypothetical protein